MTVPLPRILFVLWIWTFSFISASSAKSNSSLVDANVTVTGDEYYGSFSMTQEFLLLTQKAAHLSDLAYASDPVSTFPFFSYDTIQVFQDDVDQAVLVSFEGYCMVAFRGTDISSWDDIVQNLKTGNEPVCINGQCCNAERGFYDAYHQNNHVELENAIRDCAAQCNGSICPSVVLTGHSQGGAIAAIAAIYVADLLPQLITFGQPPTLDMPCPLVNSDRTVRFENSRVGRRGTTYDPVPYLPYQARHFGNQIMLGEDATGVAFIGQDTDIEFNPWDAENFFASHRLTSNVGYMTRIDSLVDANRNVPIIRTKGFVDGMVCSQNVECDSKSCSNERCVPSYQ
jgi:pimeloyl-ACP methyl ester carboxylesterase